MQALVAVTIALGAAIAAGVLSITYLTRRAEKRSVRSRAFASLAFAVVAVLVSIVSGQLHAVTANAAAPTTWAPAALRTGPGYPQIQRLSVPMFPAALRAAGSSAPAASQPAHGEIGSVVIPATISHFVARPAVVYLPPAALVAHPRLLPVIIALSGQSRGAGPRDLVTGGRLQSVMDHIATTHDGVAPIVVVPDQLGPATGNPMCVDSHALGHAATYVMRDVRDWILGHLPVETGRRAWTVAGFSEGGTCSIQFAAGNPAAFGSVVDVSGENAPTNGSLTHTIDVGFNGNSTAYLHATPAWLLAHHHYAPEQAYFAAGALDTTYGPVAPAMAARAHAAGMTVHLHAVPGLSHNWTVGSDGLAWAFDQLDGWWQL